MIIWAGPCHLYSRIQAEGKSSTWKVPVTQKMRVAEPKDKLLSLLMGGGGQPKRGPWPSPRSAAGKGSNRRHFAIDAIGGEEIAGIVTGC